MFILDHIRPKYCWIVAREMSGEIAVLNSCYKDDVGFSGYKWVSINGSTVYEERSSDVRKAVTLIMYDQVGTRWKVFLIFNTRSFIDFVSKWLIKRDNVLGDLGMLPPVWKGEVPKQ
jgi:hypothetical protein